MAYLDVCVTRWLAANGQPVPPPSAHIPEIGPRTATSAATFLASCWPRRSSLLAFTVPACNAHIRRVTAQPARVSLIRPDGGRRHDVGGPAPTAGFKAARARTSRRRRLLPSTGPAAAKTQSAGPTLMPPECHSPRNSPAKATWPPQYSLYSELTRFPGHECPLAGVGTRAHSCLHRAQAHLGQSLGFGSTAGSGEPSAALASSCYAPFMSSLMLRAGADATDQLVFGVGRSGAEEGKIHVTRKAKKPVTIANSTLATWSWRAISLPWSQVKVNSLHGSTPAMATVSAETRCSERCRRVDGSAAAAVTCARRGWPPPTDSSARR